MSQVTNFPPVRIPPRSHPLYQMTRPWVTDPYCVLNLRPEKGTKWVDYSGKGNHGTPSDAVFKSLGRRGDAMFFDGLNDKVDIADAASLQAFTSFSFEIWLYPTVIGGDGVLRRVFLSGRTGVASILLITDTVTTGQITLMVVNDAAAWVAPFNLRFTPALAWHHVVGVWTGSVVIVYVDGVSGTNANLGGAVSPTGAWKISDSSNDYSGLIDELRFYRRALTESEVMNLYMMGKP